MAEFSAKSHSLKGKAMPTNTHSPACPSQTRPVRGTVSQERKQKPVAQLGGFPFQQYSGFSRSSVLGEAPAPHPRLHSPSSRWAGGGPAASFPTAWPRQHGCLHLGLNPRADLPP